MKLFHEYHDTVLQKYTASMFVVVGCLFASCGSPTTQASDGSAPSPSPTSTSDATLVADAGVSGEVSTGSRAEERLCQNRLRAGEIEWARGQSSWQEANIVGLCYQASNANQRINCFEESIADGSTWQTAIRTCSPNAPSSVSSYVGLLLRTPLVSLGSQEDVASLSSQDRRTRALSCFQTAMDARVARLQQDFDEPRNLSRLCAAESQSGRCANTDLVVLNSVNFENRVTFDSKDYYSNPDLTVSCHRASLFSTTNVVSHACFEVMKSIEGRTGPARITLIEVRAEAERCASHYQSETRFIYSETDLITRYTR